MTQPPATANRSDRLFRATATFTAISVSLFPVLVLLRAYEFTLARQLHVLPDGMVTLTFQALRGDAGVVLWTAAILVLPILALAQWSARAAVQLHRALLVALVIVSVALIQVFTVTFVPLGADLFGYSPRDLRETVMSSKGVGIASLAGFVAHRTIQMATSPRWTSSYGRGTARLHSQSPATPLADSLATRTSSRVGRARRR